MSAGLVTVFSLQDNGVAVVGDIPVGLPEVGLGGVTWADVQSLLLPAVGVLVVGYTDNVLTARAFAARTGDPVDANAELLALAGANAAAGPGARAAGQQQRQPHRDRPVERLARRSCSRW